ncbi:MAG: hypothetical protein GX559_03135 [Candidatus Pacebacteria bacterium]|nr:hypothetical protein [Candidatus Paceibacterota bacterium]
MGSKKNVDMTQTETTVKIVKEKKAEKKKDQAAKKPASEAKKPAAEAKEPVKDAKEDKKPVSEDKKPAGDAKEQASEEKKPVLQKKSKKVRGKKYQAVRAQLDKTKTHDPASAIALVKKFSYSKFDASVEAHIVVKEIGTSVDLTLPHNTGKSVKVAIADEALLAEVEQGKINFDVLLASPELMPKLAKLAKILGPKGLMPNPKNGTLTPKPELKKKELEAGAFTLKTEKKAPLMHLVIGKVSMDDKMLEENILAVLKALKNRVLKVAIAPSMGPAIRLNWQIVEEK